jgi:hypothetical protein
MIGVLVLGNKGVNVGRAMRFRRPWNDERLISLGFFQWRKR